MQQIGKAFGARGRAALAVLAFSGTLFLMLGSASAQGCGGGPLSTSGGNLIGSAIGGAAGGLLGNQIGHGSGKGVATGLGVVGGALAGGYVGRSVECNNESRRAAAPSAYRPARVAAPAAAGGRTCRYVPTQAVIDGREQQVNGVACLQPDGGWKIASDPAAQRDAETDLVLRAQQQLRQKGFYVRDNIDGQWGPATSAAVRNFQRANGLAATGQLDVATETALGLENAPSTTTPAAASGDIVPPPVSNAAALAPAGASGGGAVQAKAAQ
jgi:surface antigen